MNLERMVLLCIAEGIHTARLMATLWGISERYEREAMILLACHKASRAILLFLSGRVGIVVARLRKNIPCNSTASRNRLLTLLHDMEYFCVGYHSSEAVVHDECIVKI